MKNRGFSLIELMVVVAFIGLLTTIAVPAYKDYVKTTRRADAKAALTTLANAMERNRAANDTYVGVAQADKTPKPGLYTVPSQIADSYTITIDPVTATTYTLNAAPKGAQTGDACGTFTLNEAGVTGAAAAKCW